MPRSARVKVLDGIYHIMVRSISELTLFKDDLDRCKFLKTVKKYQLLYNFKVYAYCLMPNHAHFQIDANGSDISKFMKSINQSYAAYFNKKYHRHGHVFQDRFKSKLVTDFRYLLTLSAYIHNNPRDIQDYNGEIEQYGFSSLGIYLGLNDDTFNLVCFDYILNFFHKNKEASRRLYMQFLKLDTNLEISDGEFLYDASASMRERRLYVSHFNFFELIEFIKKYTNDDLNIHIKWKHRNTELKSLVIILTRILTDMSFNDLRCIFGNTSLSNLYQLSEKGLRLINENSKYTNLIDDCIRQCCNA